MDTDGATPPSGSRDLAPTISGLDFAICSVSTIFVAIRIFTRLRVTRDLGWDDYTIVLALALVFAGKALVYMQTVYALGKQKSVIEPSRYELYLKYDLIDWVQTVTVLAISKLAICFFLLRLTQFHRLRYAIWALIAFIVACHVPFIILLVLRCQPVQKYWRESLPGTCAPKTNTEIVIILQGVFSIIIDIICAACPIVLLRTAKIKKRIKIQLCLLMGFGFLTAIACCVRTGFSYQVKSSNLSWVSVPNSLARMIEVNMGIWAACAPMMKPFSRFLRARFFNGDSRILHASVSSISFWHRSWWQRSGHHHNGSTEQRQTATASRSRNTRTVNRRQASSGWRISSLMFGDDFEEQVAEDQRIDAMTVQEMDMDNRIQNGAFLELENDHEHDHDMERGKKGSTWSDSTLRNFST